MDFPAVARRRLLAGLGREFGLALSVVAASSLALVALDRTLAPGLAVPLLDLPSISILAPMVGFCGGLLLAWRRLRHRMPWRAAWADARRGPLSLERLSGVLVAVLLVRCILLNAVAWKSSIPVLHPWAFDAELAALDHLLHGGYPHRWLPLEWVRAMDAFYVSWFLGLLVVELDWGWRAPSPRRRRFFGALALTWILGSLAAVLVSSAGPAYFGAVTGRWDPYAGHMAALRAHDLAAVGLQGRLWISYQDGGATWIKGIAAFPSLHVAMPALFALAYRRRVIVWGWWAVCALTLVGSVQLGWHFAVDGYAGVLLAGACWWLAGATGGRSPA